jgi:hypothetical protein
VAGNITIQPKQGRRAVPCRWAVYVFSYAYGNIPIHLLIIAVTSASMGVVHHHNNAKTSLTDIANQ